MVSQCAVMELLAATFDFCFISVYFHFQIQAENAAQAHTISENCFHLLLYRFWRAAGAYGNDGKDLCAEKKRPY